MLANSRENYGWISILLHFVCAIFIVALFTLGLLMVDWDYSHPYYYKGPHFHESFGIIFAIILAFRLIWRQVNPKPTPLTSSNKQARIATFVHQLFYLLMITIPISGYLISTADGRSLGVFNWFKVPAITDDIDNLATISGNIHYWLSIAIITLTVLHILAALKHHFIDKDNTLKRIIHCSSK